MIEQKAESAPTSGETTNKANLPEWAIADPKPKTPPKKVKTQEEVDAEVASASSEDVKAALHATAQMVSG